MSAHSSVSPSSPSVPWEPTHILERWGRLVWDTKDIYGKEKDEWGNVILPKATQKSIFKKGEMESSGDSSLSNMCGIKRVGFCVKERRPPPGSAASRSNYPQY